MIAITNTSAAAAAYEIAFAIPEGDMGNPVALELGYNDVSLAENSQGYYYTWTAAATGDLTFEITEITDGVEADIVISNNTSYANRSLIADGVEDDFGATVVTMPVTAGDEIVIQVVAVPDAESYVSPAADITHYSAFTYPLGSEQNPIMLQELENDLSNEGTMYYQGYFNGMIMTVTGEGDFSVIYNGETVAAVDGVVSMPVASPNPRMPIAFAIVGDGDFTVDFTYPAGSMENPAVAVLGDNVANVPANSQMGYFMTYTAEKAGDLNVSISSSDGNWMYTVNNLTAGTYGDSQWSDSDPVVNPTTITVAEGDEIQIVVNSYNPADMWNTPAATITVNLAYKEPVAPTNKLRITGVNLALMSDLKINFFVPTAVMEE
ncbi:MAG: hypothetical protein J6C66_06930, partial [Prevotella sp.]|nr:hypothetical protein [Prevotella sp.]